MFRIAVANEKGGVGKTVTAVTLAALLADRGPTLLVDADETTESAREWAHAGSGMNFEVLTLPDFEALDGVSYAYIVIDTKAGEANADLLALSGAVDLLVVPTKPDALSMRALARTLAPLVDGGVANYKVLLTDVPPAPSTDGHEARLGLHELGVPVFGRDIRRASAFNKAALLGVPVRDVRGDQRAKLAWMDYELVLREALA